MTMLELQMTVKYTQSFSVTIDNGLNRNVLGVYGVLNEIELDRYDPSGITQNVWG